jgi:hypothetical protein
LALAQSLQLDAEVGQFLSQGCRGPASHEPNVHLTCLDLRQRIQEKLLLASLEVSAAAALLDSEEERADQFANVLAEKENSLTARLTAAAIAAGAAGAVVVGLTKREELAIATGGVEAAIGLFLLRGKKKAQFLHPKNPLREFWSGQRENSVFPASLWNHFDQTPSDTNPGRSIREELIAAWAQLHHLQDPPGKPGSRTAALLFGGGGIYTKEQLRLRADMLDQLEALVNRRNEGLKALLAELSLAPGSSH